MNIFHLNIFYRIFFLDSKYFFYNIQHKCYIISILDEPTNHLDIETIEALGSALGVKKTRSATNGDVMEAKKTRV